MKFFHRKQEDKYEFRLTDGVCVELSYLPSPFYSTLSVIVGTHDIQLECDVNPAIAKGIRQYYKTNSNAQVSNELFVSQLMTLGLREVASHVNNALRSINDDCKLTSLSTFPGLTKKN